MAKNLITLEISRLHVFSDNILEQNEIMQIFLDLTATLIKRLSSLCYEDSISQWQMTAHNLKGSAANLGMQKLEELCRFCEQSDDVSPLKRIDLLKQMKEELSEIQAEWDAYARIIHQQEIRL